MIKGNSTALTKLLMAAAFIILACQLHRFLLLSQHAALHNSSEGVDNDAPMILLKSTHTNATTVNNDWENDASMLLEANNTRTMDNDWDQVLLPWSLPNVNSSIPSQSSKAFMNELNQLKQSLNMSLPWDNTNINTSITITTANSINSSLLPTPIISLNLPKSATLTLYDYFKCGGFASAHTFLPNSSTRIADCMRGNFLSGTAPFHGCNSNDTTLEEVDFYSDIGIQTGQCFYSSIHDGGLEHIAQHYPNATIVMMPRIFEDWYKSVRKWGNGRLLGMWRTKCGFRGSTGTSCSREDDACWRDFYTAHTEKIREFARTHLGLTYVELQLDEEAPSVLESYTGISSSCFQHCRPGKPKDPKVNLRKYKKCKPINDTVK